MTNTVNSLSHRWLIFISQNFPTLLNTTLLLAMVEYLRKRTLLLKIVHTTIENCTLLKDIKNFMYLTQPYFLEDTPNQILHMLSTPSLWSKTFYTTIGQYPTLYNFLAIVPKEISHWKYYLMYPNKCVRLNIF